MGKTSSRSEPSTRADRKFEKKLEFYAKVRDTIAPLGVQKAISKLVSKRRDTLYNPCSRRHHFQSTKSEEASSLLLNTSRRHPFQSSKLENLKSKYSTWGRLAHEPSTRADRKFEKKLEFYAKVRDTIAPLGVQKAISKKAKVRIRKKKLKAYDFSSLSEFLPDLKAPRQRPPIEFKLNSKSRQNLVLKEANQLKIVLNHPAFQSDPLAAIHQHLQSTQPVTDDKPERKKIKVGKKKSKKKKSRTSSGPQSMES